MKSQPRSPILLVLICLTFSAAAQQRIDTLYGVLRTFYFEDRNLILRTYADGLTLSRPEERTNTTRKPLIGWEIPMAYNDFFFMGDRLICVDRFDRSIFQVTDDSIRLRDRIPHPKVSINTRLFAFDSSVYLLGGYGLWSNRKALLTIDPIYHRWSPVAIKRQRSPFGEPVLPPPLHDLMLLEEPDRVYVLYGRMVNPNNPLDMPLNREVWSYEPNSHQWTHLGTMNPDIFHEFPDNMGAIRCGNRSIIFPGNHLVAEVLADENRVVLHQPTLFSREIQKSEPFRTPPFFEDGKIHYYQPLDGTGSDLLDRFVYTSIPIRQVFGPVIREDTLYTPPGRWVIHLLGAVLSFYLILTSYRYFSRRRRIQMLELTSSGIQFKAVQHELDPLSLAVLNKLLESESEISSADILAIVENPHLKYAHNNRVKNTIIRQLNLQLRSILNIKEDLITSSVSQEDKRYRFYRLDKTWFKGK